MCISFHTTHERPSAQGLDRDGFEDEERGRCEMSGPLARNSLVCCVLVEQGSRRSSVRNEFLLPPFHNKSTTGGGRVGGSQKLLRFYRNL